MDGNTHAGLTWRAARRLSACALLGLVVAASAGPEPTLPPWDTPLPVPWAEIAETATAKRALTEAERAERALSEGYTQSRSPLQDTPARPEAIGAGHLLLMPVTK